MTTRWRKQKSRGRSKWLIHVRSIDKGSQLCWYGCGHNTYAAGVTFATMKEAKENAMAHFKEWKKTNGAE